MKSLFLIILVGLAVGCASGQQILDESRKSYVDKYEAELRRWKDHNVSDLVADWGIPTKTFKSPDSTTLYEYDISKGSMMDTTYNKYTDGSLDTIQIKRGCRTTFTVDVNNKVTGWKWHGNACRAPE